MPYLRALTRWRRPVAGTVLLGAIGLAALAAGSLHVLRVTDARLRSTAQSVRQDDDARRVLRTLLMAVEQAEAAQRGYLLTDDPSHLVPYRVAKEQVERGLAALAANPRWSGPDQINLIALEAIAREKTAELDQALGLHDAGQREAAMAVVRSAGGNALTERMRALVTGMADNLIVQLDADRAEHERSRATALALAIGGVAFAALALLVACVVVVTQLLAHRKVEATLLAGRDAAQAADRAKSHFLAVVSHDLRQPLHAINLFVAALRRRLDGNEAQSMVENIGIAAQAMQRTFNALLDVARLDAGTEPVQPRSFALDEVFHPLRTKFAPIAAAKGLTLSIAGTHLFVWTDPVLLESILRNLLSNAIAYTVSGSVTMTAQRHDQTLEIEVRDTGPGIPADRLDAIFEEFTRLDPADPSRPGIGLGLAIVRRLAEMLGARVSVDSTPGQGSQFTVSLPFVPGEIAASPPPEDDAAPDLAGLRILLVDDDPLVLQATAAEITTWGARPLSAGSAAEAMTIMERMTPDVPDAAIIDQGIDGEVSGVVLLDRIAARFAVALPAVVVTGVTTAGVREELTESGHPWLLKPADPAVLRRLLARSIADARTEPQRPAPIGS